MEIKRYNIVPVPKPRMGQSDKKIPRKITSRYWAFKDEIRLSGMVLPEFHHIIFIIPMPESRPIDDMKKKWNMEYRAERDGTPHKRVPDCDNMIKSVYDSLYENDSHIWTLSATKLWGYDGSILIIDVEKQAKAFFRELDKQITLKGV